MREVALREGIYNLIIAGDLFDAKGRIPVVVINHVYRELCKWSEEGFQVLVIPGNHDHALRTGEEHGLSVFRDLDGFMVIDEPEKFYWSVIDDFGEENWVYVSAVPYRDKLRETYFSISEEDEAGDHFLLCVAHGVVGGTHYRKDQGKSFAVEGDGVVDHEGLREFDVIRRNWLEPFDRSIVGHVHLPQKTGRYDHILIPGMPWQQYPHECGEYRGIWILSTDEDVDDNHLRVPDIPFFIRADLHIDGRLSSRVKGQGGENLSMSIVPGNIVLVTPESSAIEQSVVNDALSKLRDSGASFVELTNPREKMGDKPPRIELNAEESPYDVLDKVLHSGHLDLKGFEPEEIRDLGNDVLDEVLGKTEEEE